MGRRTLTLLLILALLPGGCSKPSSPLTETQPPSAEGPTTPGAPVHSPEPEPEPAAGCLPSSQTAIPQGWIHRPYMNDLTVRAGDCAVKMVEDRLELRLQLPPDVRREAVEAALTIQSPVQPDRYWNKYRELTLRFPAGKAGEVITVRLKGPVGHGGADVDLGFTITRHPSPRITAELQHPGGAWEPVTGIPVLPAGEPLSLRFRLQNGADPYEAKRRIAQALPEVRFQLTQPEPDTLLLTIDDPPSLLAIEFRGVPNEYGAITAGGLTIYTGEAPRLVQLDPATGKEETILEEAPADLLRGSLSPDGRWLMLTGMSPEDASKDRVWVLNMETGELRLTPLEDQSDRSSPVVWLGDQLLLPVTGQIQTYQLQTGRIESSQSEAAWWESASPDGRYTIGYQIAWERENKDRLAPATLLLYDVATGTERAFPDLVQYWMREKGGYPSIPTVWSDDGRYVLIQDFHWKDQAMGEAAPRYLQLDPVTGQIQPYTGPPPAPKQHPKSLPGPGGWQIKNPSGWSALTLRSPDGAEKEHGYGLPIGWTGEGKLLLVRWDPPQRRHRYHE